MKKQPSGVKNSTFWFNILGIKMKAIIIGGTGATGREVIKQLLEDSRFETVTALVRRPYFDPHPKLTEIVIDFNDLAMYRDQIRGEVAFSCLGTTLKDAGSKEAQWRVDHDYQLEFAQIAQANGVEIFILLSAFGADAKSRIFYSRMKGTLEQNIKALDYNRLIILQPGGIERPNSTRSGEKLMMKILKAFNAIGLLKNYAPIPTTRLAAAMINSVFEFQEKFKVVNLKKIQAMSVKN